MADNAANPEPGRPRFTAEQISLLVGVLGFIFTVIFSFPVADLEIFPYISLAISGLAFLYFVWAALPFPLNGKRVVTAGIVLAAVFLGLGNYWASRPHFEITALKTLAGEKNTYEITDNLILNAGQLGALGAEVAFPLEITSNYLGKRSFGGLTARLTCNGQTREVPLWADFPKESETKRISLSMEDVVTLCQLPLRRNEGTFVAGSAELHRVQTQMSVQIIRDVAPDRPLLPKPALITFRNTPWRQVSKLVFRGGHWEIDLALTNYGAPGRFKFIHNLTRMDQEITAEPHPAWYAGTLIHAGSLPQDGQALQTGATFTETLALSDPLPTGRYVIDVFAVKEQNYAALAGAAWEDFADIWLFGSTGDPYVLIIPAASIASDPLVQGELERVQVEGFDLGAALAPLEDFTASSGSSGQRQVFERGEIYINEGRALALYGPVLDYYKKFQEDALGLPLTSIQTHTSSAGETLLSAEIQAHDATPLVVIASDYGAYRVEGWFLSVYQRNGGALGWLGPPVSEVIQRPEGQTQMFENGYLVKYNPRVDGERDYNREPVAVAYLASRGALVAVRADQRNWQDSGVEVQPGEWVEIVQVGGEWTNQQGFEPPFDANGNFPFPFQEDALLPAVPIGRLVAKIGESSPAYFEPGRWAVLKPDRAGKLFLAMNDNEYEDNDGLIVVEVIKRPRVTAARPIQAELNRARENDIWSLVDYHELTQPGLADYTARVQPGSRWRLGYAWCAYSPANLAENAQAITQRFLIDGVPVADADILTYTEEIPDGTGACHKRSTMLSNWRAGSTVQVELVITLPEPVFDGRVNYPAGEYRYALTLTVEGGGGER